MRSLAKIGLVGAGYVGAFALAAAVVAAYVAATSGPDRQDYSGMYAFGDSLLFLAVFSVASVVPSGAALYFLRPYRPFWRMLSVIALGLASTGVAALCAYATAWGSDPHAGTGAWSALAVLRSFLAPSLALAFLVSGVFAPARGPRLALLGAAAVETAVFACAVVVLFQRSR